MIETVDSQRFADLGRPRRIWAIAAIHGEAARLRGVHRIMGPRVRPGDRLVYLGNMMGRGPAVRDALDEIVSFRREVIGRIGMLVGDVIHLRGMQEEMWQKLLQLNFAPNPSEVLTWMLDQGLGATLQSYGARTADGFEAARGGPTHLQRWTQSLRAALRAAPGHEPLLTGLRRAAFTLPPAKGLLLVNAGLDPTRPLFNQGDRFWWSWRSFAAIDAQYETFCRLIRGYDPSGEGVRVGPITATLDGGCGQGGPLVAGVFDADGALIELFEA